MKIAVAGMGYVGMAMAVLLAQNHEVTAVDTDKEKVELINRGKSPIADKEIEKFFHMEAQKLAKERKLTATQNAKEAYENARFIIIATPTDYDSTRDYFDTSSVEEVARIALETSDEATIVIKSTVPVGFTKKLCEKYHTDRILFSPEFLREGHALYDNLYPSRIIVGTVKESERAEDSAREFASLLSEGALKKEIPILFSDSTEAEAIKLFANTYLALRISFFNELDTYAEMRGLDAGRIIEGVCLDQRIGMHYNNPSFGYGGYCLPKDTKQLLANYSDVPERIIEAIVEANRTRKDFIAGRILEKARSLGKSNPIIGIYRLTMKKDSDNYRYSSVRDIIRRLREKEVSVVIYEPTFKNEAYGGIPVIKSLAEFRQMSDMIVANRYDEELKECGDKVYTRDIFGRE